MSDSLKSYDSMFYENEIDSLKHELDSEKNNRDNAFIRNNDLEKSIVKIQEQLNKNEYEWENDEELMNVLNRNKELSDEVQNLKSQLPELKEKLKNAKVCGKDCKMKHDNLNINLDLLNEIELLKTIKRLERLRTDIKSELVSKEWSLDNESKLYQRILDQKMHFQNQLYHTNHTPLMRNDSLKNWQNGGLPKSFKTLDVKRQNINCEKLQLQKKLLKIS
ncbi:uncharacterized protein LOC143912059 isoform X2 [Arctopsyche grandis]|uniref:uncharacterized protein LOC143912059 isoform X2 n=1 Tax=Arctopsyche grandis TaxID=121162 RepID=UPI00406D70ED